MAQPFVTHIINISTDEDAALKRDLVLSAYNWVVEQVCNNKKNQVISILVGKFIH